MSSLWEYYWLNRIKRQWRTMTRQKATSPKGTNPWFSFQEAPFSQWTSEKLFILWYFIEFLGFELVWGGVYLVRTKRAQRIRWLSPSQTLSESPCSKAPAETPWRLETCSRPWCKPNAKKSRWKLNWDVSKGKCQKYIFPPSKRMLSPTPIVPNPMTTKVRPKTVSAYDGFSKLRFLFLFHWMMKCLDGPKSKWKAYMARMRVRIIGPQKSSVTWQLMIPMKRQHHEQPKWKTGVKYNFALRFLWFREFAKKLDTFLQLEVNRFVLVL